MIDRLSNSYNIGIEVLYDLANHKVSLRDNIASVVKDVAVIVDNNGIVTNNAGIALGGIIKQAIGTTVLFAQNQTNSTIYPTGSPFISFTQNGDTIIINHVTGLQPNNSFLLRVVIWG